jgi:acetyltransferase-like isoleucine patch superfamily enzyme
MKLFNTLRRFLVPSPVVTAIYLFKHKCKISPRAEVELSAFLRMGRGTVVSSFSKIKANGPMNIGENVSIGTNCFISSDAGGVNIGAYSMIGSNACIIGNNYNYNKLDVPICLQEKTSKGINIARNVWIGSGCSILDGASIGEGAIITPNSVVSGKVPENAITQGNPAKVIFTRR